jgi:hypothetical protein
MQPASAYASPATTDLTRVAAAMRNHLGILNFPYLAYLCTSFASVAANFPRCHTFFSSAARIVADDTIVRLGCANWGFYGIA